MKKQRPVNLDLKTIHFPVTAIISILHRVSGVMTFIAVGILLGLWGWSLSSEEGFEQAMMIMHSLIVKFVIWGILTAMVLHICGGVRHLLMDFGYLKETLAAGTTSARIVIGLTIVLSALAGVLIW